MRSSWSRSPAAGPPPRGTSAVRETRMFLRPLLASVALVMVGSIAGVTAGVPAGTAATGNVVTPGNFRGFGFDQCLAPTQKAMDTWLRHSPFFAVGIYISGASRACRDQPNLTPAWVTTQLES